MRQDRNRLGEHTNASLAISDGDILIRTDDHLWRIAGVLQETALLPPVQHRRQPLELA